MGSRWTGKRREAEQAAQTAAWETPPAQAPQLGASVGAENEMLPLCPPQAWPLSP